MPRALVSVSDKQGLVSFVTGLVELDFEIVSTGGTLRALHEAGLPAMAISDATGYPEILGGRVKTLHPAVHGGILARRTPEHRAQLQELGIHRIGLVAVNLYPFRQTVSRSGVTLDEALEQIDIGGSTLLRAAAKNHPSVTVVVDPGDYPAVLAALRQGRDPDRRALARKAFAHTAAYDAAVVRYLDLGTDRPETIHLTLERAADLRYGENPHQAGARYREEGRVGFWDAVIQHKGKALSYLNLFDADTAYRLACEFEEPACAIVKHANPCGVAVGEGALEAYRHAFACDPKSAFGGVVALNRPVDEVVSEAIMANPKADVLISPGYADGALRALARRRKEFRVLEAPAPGPPGPSLRRIDGGFLVQEADHVPRGRLGWRVVTREEPTESEWRDLEMANLICAYTSSNAVVLVADGQAVGVGAGQQSRVDAGELAARKAEGRARGGACASDAFYPFRDGLDAAAAAGVAAVIQPGGSVRDDEVIAAADEYGIAMVFTGRRHFRH